MNMTRKGKIEMAFEIARVFIYGDQWRWNAAWCERCESYVPLVTPASAAELESTTEEAIDRRMDTGELHHHITVEGTLLVCLGSLIDPVTPPNREMVIAERQFIQIRPTVY